MAKARKILKEVGQDRSDPHYKPLLPAVWVLKVTERIRPDPGFSRDFQSSRRADKNEADTVPSQRLGAPSAREEA